MAKLIYTSIMSVDGYIGDGHYDWSAPVEGSTAFITETIRAQTTFLYGRRNFETMCVWDSPEFTADLGDEHQEFAKVWRAAEKIVFSKTLQSVNTKNTRLEREFDLGKIRQMKAASPGNIGIGGPSLAAQAMRAGLVDEIQLFVVPDTIGGGKPVIPVLPRDFALKLELLEEKRFSKGWVYLRYGVLS